MCRNTLSQVSCFQRCCRRYGTVQCVLVQLWSRITKTFWSKPTPLEHIVNYLKQHGMCNLSTALLKGGCATFCELCWWQMSSSFSGSYVIFGQQPTVFFERSGFSKLDRRSFANEISVPSLLLRPVATVQEKSVWGQYVLQVYRIVYCVPLNIKLMLLDFVCMFIFHMFVQCLQRQTFETFTVTANSWAKMPHHRNNHSIIFFIWHRCVDWYLSSKLSLLSTFCHDKLGIVIFSEHHLNIVIEIEIQWVEWFQLFYTGLTVFSVGFTRQNW